MYFSEFYHILDPKVTVNLLMPLGTAVRYACTARRHVGPVFFGAVSAVAQYGGP